MNAGVGWGLGVWCGIVVTHVRCRARLALAAFPDTIICSAVGLCLITSLVPLYFCNVSPSDRVMAVPGARNTTAINTASLFPPRHTAMCPMCPICTRSYLLTIGLMTICYIIFLFRVTRIDISRLKLLHYTIRKTTNQASCVTVFLYQLYSMKNNCYFCSVESRKSFYYVLWRENVEFVIGIKTVLSKKQNIFSQFE